MGFLLVFRTIGRLASVDKATSGLTRVISSLMPLNALRVGSIQAREFLKLSIDGANKDLSFEKAPLGESYNVESISYSDPTGEAVLEEMSFIYIHGGAFSLCDSGDLLVCERLIPQIQKYTGAKKVTMYSVLYTLATPDQSATFPMVHAEILRSYDAVVGHLKRFGKGNVVALVGDSAGANLCYCLAMQLLHRNESDVHTPALALISPWLHLANDQYRELLKKDEYKHDILSWEFIRRSKINYFGPTGYPPTTASVEIGMSSLPSFCINPWETQADSPLVQNLPSIYCVAGTREMLVEEIVEFWSSRLALQPDDPEVAESKKEHKKHKKKHNKVTFSEQQVGAGGSRRARRQFSLVEDEIHAFPLFWQHPVRRLLGPFNLHWLFELLYPVPNVVSTMATEGAMASTSPRSPLLTPNTPGEVERASIWKDVSTPRKSSDVSNPMTPGFLSHSQAISKEPAGHRVDSIKANTAIEEIARFISDEYEAML